MTVQNAVVSGLESNLMVASAAVLAMVIFLSKEIGVNLFAHREATEFAKLARRYPLVRKCIETEAPNLLHSWNSLVHHSELTKIRKNSKLSRGSLSKRRKANNRALRNSGRSVESFLRGYAASYGSTAALGQLNALNTRWQTWRGVITATMLSVIGLCLVVPVMTQNPVWAHDPVVTNLATIALFLEIVFLAFVFVSFEATYKSSCLALFSLISILYSEKAFAGHEPPVNETGLNVK
ncbi:MAG: hypothetical protein ABR905_07575 [Terracidiphilus sp.]|jgi:hypothetical protein